MKLSRVHTLKDHISNVKCMTIYKSVVDGSHLVFSGGARAQLVITRISINQKETENIQNEAGFKATFQTLKTCHLGAEWLTHKQRKQKSFKSNPETRIMNLCVVGARDILTNCLGSIYIVGAACSDGYVRYLHMLSTCAVKPAFTIPLFKT